MIRAGTVIVCPNCGAEVGKTVIPINFGEMLDLDLFNLYRPPRTFLGNPLLTPCCNVAIVHAGQLSTKFGWLPERPLETEAE